MEYEICYLIGESKEAETEKIKEKIKKIISEKGGEFSDFNFSDKRKMAYEIKNETRGTFFANRFEISEKDMDKKSEAKLKSVIGSITEKLYLEKDILRFIIVKADLVPLLKEKEEKKSGYVKSDKAEKKENAKQFKKPEEKENFIKKEPFKKSVKIKKEGDIDKKLEEILRI